MQKSQDPEGLKVFYYFVQDLKCLVFSLITSHFKVSRPHRPSSPVPPADQPHIVVYIIKIHASAGAASLVEADAKGAPVLVPPPAVVCAGEPPLVPHRVLVCVALHLQADCRSGGQGLLAGLYR